MELSPGLFYTFTLHTRVPAGFLLEKVKGDPPPLLPEGKKILKIWPWNGAFWNLYVIQAGPQLSYAVPDRIRLYVHRVRSQKNCSYFAYFRFLNLHPFSRRGQLTPFAPMCRRPCVGAIIASPSLPSNYLVWDWYWTNTVNCMHIVERYVFSYNGGVFPCGVGKTSAVLLRFLAKLCCPNSRNISCLVLRA